MPGAVVLDGVLVGGSDNPCIIERLAVTPGTCTGERLDEIQREMEGRWNRGGGGGCQLLGEKLGWFTSPSGQKKGYVGRERDGTNEEGKGLEWYGKDYGELEQIQKEIDGGAVVTE